MYRDHEKRRGLWLLLLLAGRVGVRQSFPHRIERGEKVSELVRADRLKDHKTRLLQLERGHYRTYP